MDNIHQTLFAPTGFSTNAPSLSISNKERWVMQTLTTKFHTKPAIETESGVRLNLVTRDLIIKKHVDNKPATKRKRRKWQKTEVKTEMIESIGENLAWLSTLEEEIAKLRYILR